jgi:hypothetical protein
MDGTYRSIKRVGSLRKRVLEYRLFDGRCQDLVCVTLFKTLMSLSVFRKSPRFVDNFNLILGLMEDYSPVMSYFRNVRCWEKQVL